MITKNQLKYSEITPLKADYPDEIPTISADVYFARKERLICAMKNNDLDVIAIYADREHYHNFKFYTGRDPRFEEGLLVVHRDGRMYSGLGNECLNLTDCMSVETTPVLCQLFSLPNQPMESYQGIGAMLDKLGFKSGQRVGCVDWKFFNPDYVKDCESIFGMPSYLIDGIKEAVGKDGRVINVTALLINPADGLRTCVEPAAAAALEFGATCASEGVRRMMDEATPGMTECELANAFSAFGQPLSCHPYVVSGENTRNGLISPGNRELKLGDELIVSVGIEGGLSCRSAMLAANPEDLAVSYDEYIQEWVMSYMATVFNWYQMIGIGVKGGEIYDMVQSSFPKEKYGWTLNPGHLLGHEEWMSSPIYENSECVIKSGMILQMDIIPSSDKFRAPNAEDGVLIADEDFRAQLKKEFPKVYERMMKRRRFAEEQIGLKLRPEVMPMANTFAEYRPLFMKNNTAIVVSK